MGAMAVTDARTITQGLREARALAFFGSWVILGLFVDGWSHQANKPETFFTPWHGLLYSGFVAGVLWFTLETRRGSANAITAPDRLTTIGLVLFVAGAVGDGVWHEVFGIEVDLEALLSPTHLLLMTGGLLLLSSPIRFALTTPSAIDPTPTLRRFFPVLVPLTLCASLATFFTMYLGANWPIASMRGTGQLGQALGVASVLVRNTLLMAPLLLASTRWRLPFGSCTFLMSMNGLAMAALVGFRFPALVAPFVVGGVVGDLLNAQRSSWWIFSLAVPLATWTAFFLIHAARWSMTWTVELWAGAIYLAAVSSYGFAALLRTAGSTSPASS